jgi:3-oxoacyl-[acyl-carrier protein] reductase
MSSLTDNDRRPLSGRVALVTGASRGLGAAITFELARAGATVAVNYQTDGRAAAAVVAAAGAGAWSLQADVRDAEEASTLVDAVSDRAGGLDVVIANAGVWRGGRIDELAPEDWQLVLDTSLGGAFNVIRAAAPALRRSGRGRIVAIGSIIGLIGFPGDSAYATAKAGLVGLVRSLAKELGRDGITVNAVAPGLIDTDMTASLPQTSRERLLSRTCIRRPGQPEEVARAVRFLVCDGDYVTGQVLAVDGGLGL